MDVHYGRSPECELCRYILGGLLENQYVKVKGGRNNGDDIRAINDSV